MLYKSWKDKSKVMYEMWLEGKSFDEIGKSFGVTRQYISLIFLELFPDRPKNCRARGSKTIPLKLSDLDRTQRARFTRKKQNSKQTGWEWLVKFHEINWPTHCPILGLEIDYFTEIRKENSASFDRIDNSKGYVKGNVHIISWRANRIKNDGTAEEHRKIADYLEKK